MVNFPENGHFFYKIRGSLVGPNIPKIDHCVYFKNLKVYDMTIFVRKEAFDLRNIIGKNGLRNIFALKINRIVILHKLPHVPTIFPF